MMDQIKKVLSYILPARLRTYFSKISGPLEVNMIAGKKTLDTVNSNYSYGSLQKILHKALLESSFNENVKNILVLGMGGGSIIETIRLQLHSNAFITLVDVDPVVIKIANEEFDIGRFNNISIVESDAAAYMEMIENKFDLVVCDIFILNKVPDKFTTLAFISSLCERLNPGGKIIFNTMRLTMPPVVYKGIKNNLLGKGLTLNELTLVEGSNDVIIATKAF